MHATIIRHGMTVGNTERRYTGVSDVPLCEAGREQAERAKKDPDRTTVYVSPLRRTHETAAILFPNAKQIVVDGLQEMDFGVFEGRTADEMEHDPAYRAWVEDYCRGACPGGESQEGFRARVTQAFETVIRTVPNDALFVLHGGVLMAILSEYAVPARDFYDWTADNLGGFAFDVVFDHDKPTLSNVTPVQY